MASVHIKRRAIKTGFRYIVRYRLGGRTARQMHGGSFQTFAEAEKHRDWLRSEIASGRVRHGAPAIVSRRRAELVYFASLGDLIKIGVSVDPARRVRYLNAELLHVEDGGRARERELHEAFKHARLSGEWFRDDGRIQRYLESRAREPESVSPTEGMRPSVASS